MSTLIVTRSDFQRLAEVRLVEAKILLDAGLWDGAYYLAGYAVEVALKACIIKKVMATDAFPDKQFSFNCYTHNLSELISVAGLKAAKIAAGAGDVVLADNWTTVDGWSEQKRYHRTSEPESRALYDSIADLTHGVLTWIRTQW